MGVDTQNTHLPLACLQGGAQTPSLLLSITSTIQSLDLASLSRGGGESPSERASRQDVLVIWLKVEGLNARIAQTFLHRCFELPSNMSNVNVSSPLEESETFMYSSLFCQ